MRGNAPQTKVHMKGKDEDFIVFVESKEAVQNWKKDKTVPLAQVVGGWKIFVTHRYVISLFYVHSLQLLTTVILDKEPKASWILHQMPPLRTNLAPAETMM